MKTFGGIAFKTGGAIADLDELKRFVAAEREHAAAFEAVMGLVGEPLDSQKVAAARKAHADAFRRVVETVVRWIALDVAPGGGSR